jgi:hypothetical protein
LTRRIVVPAAPLPAPFRAATRTSRLVADDDGLHWLPSGGRRRTWRRGPEGPATARVLSGAHAGVPRGGRPPGPLLVIGDAAERPLLVVPVAEWSPAPPKPGRGDPLRDTALRPLVDSLGLALRTVDDGSLAALSSSDAPVARALPRWTGLQSLTAALGAVALALGTVLGISRWGESTAWAAVALVGMGLVLAAGAGPLLAGVIGERRTAGSSEAVLQPDAQPRRLLLARTEHGLEIGVREDDGVERWVPVGKYAGAVAAVRVTPAAVELVDSGGAVLQSLHGARWLPDAAAREALERLCAAAGVPMDTAPAGHRVPPPRKSDLPSGGATWPLLLPGAGLLSVIGGALGGRNGFRLLIDADGTFERFLGGAFLVLAAASLLLWLWLRFRRP